MTIMIWVAIINTENNVGLYAKTSPKEEVAGYSNAVHAAIVFLNSFYSPPSENSMAVM